MRISEVGPGGRHHSADTIGDNRSDLTLLLVPVVSRRAKRPFTCMLTNYAQLVNTARDSCKRFVKREAVRCHCARTCEQNVVIDDGPIDVENDRQRRRNLYQQRCEINAAKRSPARREHALPFFKPERNREPHTPWIRTADRAVKGHSRTLTHARVALPRRLRRVLGTAVRAIVCSSASSGSRSTVTVAVTSATR